MEKIKFSELQKWILINCYKITIQKDRSDTPNNCCSHFTSDCKDNIELVVDIYMGHDFSWLKCKKENTYNIKCEMFNFRREEIMKHYYGLDRLSREDYNSETTLKIQNKAHSSLTRSLKNLRKYNLIKIHYEYGKCDRYSLTEYGQEVAKKLIDKQN